MQSRRDLLGFRWGCYVDQANDVQEVRLSELGESGAEDRYKHAKYKRWVEIDQEQAKVWRYAWDLLLTDQHTLAQICEKLAERGYRLRDGRPFVTIGADGKRRLYIQQLSRAFHNWHYAGWVHIENDWAQIPPKTVKAEWEPIVSTEEFEQGLAILARRSHRPSPKKRHFHLLQGLIYLQQTNGKVRKLRCSTPNANRARGGVAYYCIPSSNQNYLCWQIDQQVPAGLHAVQIDPAQLPSIRKAYLADTDRFTSNRSQEIQALRTALKRLDDKELNLWRGFTELRPYSREAQPLWYRVSWPL